MTGSVESELRVLLCFYAVLAVQSLTCPPLPSSLRIPFFAPPPEKEVKEAPKPLVVSLPGTATATEQPEASTSAAASEEEEVEPKINAQTLLGEKRVKGVDQPIRKIVVMNKFLSDDQRRYEDEDDDDEGLLGEKADADDLEDEEEDEEDVDADLSLSIPVIEGESDDEDEDDLTWDDVNGGEGSSIPASAKGKARAVEEDTEGASLPFASCSLDVQVADSPPLFFATDPPAKRSRKSIGDEDETEAEKEKRMTTSKKKAESFYTNANVKNRNRDKGRKEVKQDGGRARPGKKGAGMSGNIKAGGKGGRK